MKQSVIDMWHHFSEPLEGRVYHMYLDVKGLVTAGVGNLADPVGLALMMPWELDGKPASADQVRRDWTSLKAQQNLAKLHYKYAAKVTKVRLTDDGIDSMVAKKLASNELYMRQTFFPDWDAWPADAQLGVCSMAWAMGPGFPSKFGNFTRAAKAQRWLEAMAACKIREAGNPGIVPRNRANRLCFANAATVLASGLDPEQLYWPNEAPSFTGPGELSPDPHEAETDPAIVLPFSPDPNIEAVHEQRDADIADEEDTQPETPEAKDHG